MADSMYVVLQWKRYPTWPDGAVGLIVSTEAEAIADAEQQAARAAARGSNARFTVHQIPWPPIHDTRAEK